ncbi:MAG: hypothetical protein CSA03_01735 [Bacteroidetes bacterium]|nr:MAG: hypothetical protein CSA03_01735 [Bacteroidota bacterium]
MKKLYTLIKNDLKLIVRDKTLLSFLLLPPVLIIAFKFLTPILVETAPILEEYRVIIGMFASIQTAIMFGFVTSFLILDEKDENVMNVIRILPISGFYFILYRLLFATVFSSIAAYAMITLSDIAHPGNLAAILLAILYGMTAPTISLAISTYAKNKVEGMAYFKGIDLLLMLPIASFFVGSSLSMVFSILPTYWVFHFYETSYNDAPAFEFFAVGFCFFGILISLLLFQFRKRVFGR